MLVCEQVGLARGPSGSGKSELLRQLKTAYEKGGWSVRVIDLLGISSEAQFVRKLKESDCTLDEMSGMKKTVILVDEVQNIFPVTRDYPTRELFFQRLRSWRLARDSIYSADGRRHRSRPTRSCVVLWRLRCTPTNGGSV